MKNSDTMVGEFPVGHEMPQPGQSINIGGSDHVRVADIAVQVIAEINRQPQQLTNLARAAIDARSVLFENIKGIGTDMDDFNAKLKLHLDTLRAARFSFVTETAQILSPLKEIRQFFLSNTYDHEINRLKEFVDLCERLQKLKQSGFLDTVADTMLKLA